MLGQSMGNFYRYRLRFFALLPDPARLVWYPNETCFRENQTPLHTVHLEGSSLGSAAKHTGNPNSFGIFHPSRNEIYLMCPDTEQYQWWMQALEGVLINPQSLSLKDFEVLALVGRGSFGQVLQVKKKDTNAIYALKILEKSHVKKRCQVENTKSERRVLEIVNHPFIVQVIFPLKYATCTASRFRQITCKILFSDIT
jgi:hypothetical protein